LLRFLLLVVLLLCAVPLLAGWIISDTRDGRFPLSRDSGNCIFQASYRSFLLFRTFEVSYAVPGFLAVGIALYLLGVRIGTPPLRDAACNACRHCGYDLTGNVSGVCPECGGATR
jgi:hypothetical protein